jgi:DNA topoisomerase IB
LLAYRSGPRWHDVTAADLNNYLREISEGDYTAKDFRTWHATVLAAVGLAVSEPAARCDAYLGNTRRRRASYIDPREDAVVKLLASA